MYFHYFFLSYCRWNRSRCQHAQPELRALVLTNGDAQNFLPTFLVEPQYHVGRRFADHVVLPHVEHDGVDVHYGINAAQRPFLPRLNLRQKLVRDRHLPNSIAISHSRFQLTLFSIYAFNIQSIQYIASSSIYFPHAKQCLECFTQ